jgi:predicted transcriptional regulator
MVRRRRAISNEERVLTEAELLVMRSLWQIREGTVTDVQVNLDTDPMLAYTTVSTILRILEEKQFVEAKSQGRSHVYSPLVTREAYEQRAVRHLVSRLFQSNPLSMVKHLIASNDISEQDLSALRQMIDQLDSQHK